MTVDVRERLGVEHAVLQAALGGGLARAELASAVSRAGGLGTVGMTAPVQYRREIQQTRDSSNGRPFASNLLFPALRRAHVEACILERVPVVSLFFGFDARVVRALKGAGSFVLHQIGTREQALRALADGADGLIVQGLDAGGHVLATEPLDRIVPEIVALAGDRVVLAAGGIHDRKSAMLAQSLGAGGVSVGTRFLLTHESHAHDAYKRRLLEADTTFVTLLFGMGWHAPHRVVPNLATERWCGRDPLGPRWVRAVNRTTDALGRFIPSRASRSAVERQRAGSPFFTPIPLSRGMDEKLVDATPLYAGICATKVTTLVPAREVVREISPF